MPPSDRESLDHNKFDGFYKVRARDFWGDNKVNAFPEPVGVKCEHEFKPAEGGAKCTKCHFGLLGQFEVQQGKLFYKGDPIGL